VNDAIGQPTYVFEGFRLDTQHRTLLGVDGRPVGLAPKTLDTLFHLVSRAGQVVGKHELLEAVWPHVVVEENNLNQAISQLRRALGERPEERRFIVTEPGRGYRFVAVVTVAEQARTEGSLAADKPPTASLGGTAKRPSPPWLALGAVLAAGLVGVGWYLGQDGAATLPSSIAVLPFDNLSSDPDNEFFAAGLHGEILSQLTKISALNVIGQTTTLRVAESGQSPRQIAAALGVQTVLHATVEYADDRVRIRPQLISGATGQTLWAESYDRGFEDIFAIESEIAAEIVAALKAELSLAEQTAVVTPATTSPAAYAAYLRARHVQNISNTLTLEYLDEATTVDPQFSLAHATKAEVYANTLITQSTREAADPSETAELERRIREAANEALRLDPRQWLAHRALGNLHAHRWRWTEALDEYERAAANTPSGIRRIAEFEPFFRDLDFTENLREQRSIVALNPLAANEHWVLGLYHAYQREAESAAAAFHEAVSLSPDTPAFHVWLAHAEGMLGRRAEALAALRRAEQLPQSHDSSISLANIAYSYAQNDEPVDARRIVDLLVAQAPDRRHQAGHWALAYLAVGDSAAARGALTTVVEKIANQEPDAGFLALRLIQANIYSDPVLEQPEFQALRMQLRGR